MIEKKYIEDEFQTIWNRFSNELRITGGKIDLDVSTHNASVQRVLTTVVRVCPEACSRISDTLKHISRDYPEHYYYPSSDLHFTILNCMPFLENPDRLEPSDIQRIASLLDDVFYSYKPFVVELKGLNLFPTTVFVQVFDLSGTIASMRHQIRQRLKNDAWHPQIESQQLLPKPIISYVNAIRFQYRVPREFVDVISQYRKAKLGFCQVQEVELVTTDKFLSKRNTVTWKRYTLGR